MHSPRIDVVCGLIEHEDRVLACLRPPDKHLAGLWEFPGGKVEANESREAALIRELAEELHIHVRVTRALTPVDWADPQVHIRLHPFLCQLVSGTPHPAEHSEIRWCTPSELPHLPWAEADIPIYCEWLSLRKSQYPFTPPC